jgi:hypothetical protein
MATLGLVRAHGHRRLAFAGQGAGDEHGADLALDGKERHGGPHAVERFGLRCLSVVHADRILGRREEGLHLGQDGAVRHLLDVGATL